MRIAIISSYPPMRCGIGEYTKSLVSELRKRHEVFVIAAKTEVEKDEENVIRAWTRGGAKYHEEILNAVEELGPFDIIEYQFEEGGWPLITSDKRGVELLKGLRKYGKLVITIHSLKLRFEDKWWFYRFVTRVADAVLLHHAHQAFFLRWIGGDMKSVHVVPHGTRTFKVNCKEEDFFLVAGLLRANKGIEEAIKAAMKANVNLVVAGVPLKGFERYAELLKRRYGDKIKFIFKYFSGDELACLLKRAKGVLLSYKDVPFEIGISGALHDVMGVKGRALCSLSPRLIECYETVPQATFPEGDVERLATLIKKIDEIDYEPFWKYGENTSWYKVAKLRERIYASL